MKGQAAGLTVAVLGFGEASADVALRLAAAGVRVRSSDPVAARVARASQLWLEDLAWPS
jgi:phosphoglycerate dehydrogenase-like enzyme